jgi:hypothetical protein
MVSVTESQEHDWLNFFDISIHFSLEKPPLSLDLASCPCIFLVTCTKSRSCLQAQFILITRNVSSRTHLYRTNDCKIQSVPRIESKHGTGFRLRHHRQERAPQVSCRGKTIVQMPIQRADYLRFIRDVSSWMCI